MSKINAFVIQERLRKTDYVTVPQIQKEYGLDYGDAKHFLDILIKRKWAEAEPKGMRHAVIHKNLHLRKLEREEVEGIIEDISYDGVALLRIEKEDFNGINSFNEKKLIAYDDDETKEAIEFLDKHRLIRIIGDEAFVSVSRKTVDVLSEVAKRKRRSETRSRLSPQTVSTDSLKKLFDVLFTDN